MRQAWILRPSNQLESRLCAGLFRQRELCLGEVLSELLFLFLLRLVCREEQATGVDNSVDCEDQMRASVPKDLLSCELARTLVLVYVLILLFFLFYPNLCSSFSLLELFFAAASSAFSGTVAVLTLYCFLSQVSASAAFFGAAFFAGFLRLS